MALGDPKPHKDEKTEAPSAKRMSKQKSEGNVFMSQEMAGAIVVFFAAWALKFLGPILFYKIFEIMKESFELIAVFRIDEGNMTNYFMHILFYIIKMLAPFFVVIMAIGAISTIGQTGWIVSKKALRWKFKKLFSFHWKEVVPFNGKKALELGLNILKIFFLGYILYSTFRDTVNEWIPFMDSSVFVSWCFLCQLMLKVMMKFSLFMIVLSILDYLYRHKKYIDDLKMTKQEVKDERKQGEGDPRIKAMVKSRRFSLFRKIMMQAVPKADVIITNPTHFAVAIQYDAKSMEAPKVVAKGVAKLAERIKELGRKHSIPIVENKPLAQVLFKTVEVGSLIPVSLYKAVAEILAYVYKLKNKKAA